MKLRLSLLAALLAVASGCKKEPASAPANPTPAAAPAKKDPLAEVPGADSTLSVLEPQGGKCQWVRQDPVAQKRAGVASFDGDCKGARIAWSADGQKALVWFDPALVQTAGYSAANASPPAYPDEQPAAGASPRLYEVTIASGEVRPVRFPSVEGELRDIGYKGADAVALAIRALTPEQAQGDLRVDGQAVTLPEGDGMPAVAQAYRLEKDGQFKRVEVKGTREGAEGAAGIGALDAASGLGPRSTELLDSHLSDEGPEPTEEQRAKLQPLVPAPLVETVKASGLPEGTDWAHGVTPAGSFYVWQITGDTAHTTGHLVFEREGQFSPVKDLGFTDGELVSVTARGPFVLIAAERVGTHPRLYDLRTGKQVFKSDTARATTFWPKP